MQERARVSGSPPSSANAGDARLLAFLAPGLAHAFGNNLFAARGAASVLGEKADGGRPREILVEALGEAEQVLGLLRLFAEPESRTAPEQAGVLLARLARVCRVPLRDRALELELSHSSLRTPRAVDPGRFVRAVGEVLRCAVEGLPSFVSGTLKVDLAEQVPTEVIVALSVQPKEPMLPFPFELPTIARNAESVVQRIGGRLEPREPDALLVHVPAC